MPVLGRLADLQPVSRGGYTPYQLIGLDCHELRVSRKPQESCLTPTQTPSCLGAHTQISHETQHLLSHYKPAVHTLDHTVSGNTRGAGGTGVVDVGTQLVSGDGVPPPPPNLHGDDRRIPPGVGGGTPRGGTGPRPVVSTGVRGPRQPARSIGGPRDAPSLRTTVDGASSAHTDRQLDGGCLPEQSGGYSLKSALQTYGNAASVVL